MCCFLMNTLVEKKYVARGLKNLARQDYKCYPGKKLRQTRGCTRDSDAFQKYLDFGANVCSDPAVERGFGSIDYLVMLHFHQMTSQIYRFFTRDLLLQTE